MTTTSTGTRRRPLSLDPRLLIGLLLVAASVVGVVTIVSAAGQTLPVYAARQPLAPGDRIQPDDLVTTNVRVDDAARLYLLPGDVPSEGFVVTRPVDEGELIPASAVGTVEGLRLTSIVLQMDGALSASVGPGSVVDVWAARAIENRQYGPPVVIASGAQVVRLLESDSMVSGGRTTAIEVLVAKARVARVLEAVANSDAVSIVPASIPGRG